MIIDIDGFEGPLDLLLALARNQKVDLAKISVLDLVEQYLAFMARSESLRLERAADYLVMAAWLAYLKSRLLLPQPQGEDESICDDLSARLAFRLRRLEAMRVAAVQLLARPQLNDNVFPRGVVEPFSGPPTVVYDCSFFDLLKAYTDRRQKLTKRRTYEVTAPQVLSLKEARDVLNLLTGEIHHWISVEKLLVRHLVRPGMERSVLASSFAVLLEMAREGRVEVQQERHFAPLFVRTKPTSTRPDTA
ncbi:segregation and condensation protein A [Rhodoligotrophos appendicifer]|uniref:segregation and condensation protein A n=1 Tax=Rhodoligotrophos appendicifer TaxID=987056 RepID=UPI003D179DE4